MRRGKAELITLYRKIAAKFPGETVGKRRFETESDVGEAEWKYYWPRWADFVAEAGFQAGQYVERKSDEELLLPLIPLIRKLDRWPTDAELRIYSRDVAGVPSGTTLRSRGDKFVLAQTLAQLCRDAAEHQDVVAICDAVAEDAPAEDLASSRPVSGYVYLMKNGAHHKLGKSKDPEVRRKEIALLLPNPTQLIHVIATDDPDGIEAYWHRRFAAKRIRGEFFKLDSQDVKAFKRRKDYM